ncbi:hypothetical protein KKA53_00280 [Candidatus Dependentiae bacterium]|nr:hypothetical protein [Candidatus Dependentiae bacterium]
MTKRFFVFVFVFTQLFGFTAVYAVATVTKSNARTFTVTGPHCGLYSRLKNQMLCSSKNPLLFEVARIVRDDLNFTDQFDVDLKKKEHRLTAINLKELFKQGVSLVTAFGFVEKNKKRGTRVHVRIRDTSSNHVVFDKTVTIERKNLVAQGHNLSGDILQKLTGDRGICSTSVVYCKMVSSHHKIICLADYACKRECVVVPAKTINLAPSWHTKVPVLFYSQLTKSNNRLMSVDLRTGRHSVICSYSGLNMQPAFSGDGKTAAICLSGGRGNSELYLYDPRMCKEAKKRVFKPLTHNGAHNVSPCMLANGDIVFCSDYETGLPQIYYLNRKTGGTRRLTGGNGYCAAPSYCPKTNMLVYTRPVKGVFQLFALSLDNLDVLDERRITSCPGNKHEPSWSECGRYIAFSIDQVGKKKKSSQQIAALNYKSGNIRILTRTPEPKSFPRWTGQQLWPL